MRLVYSPEFTAPWRELARALAMGQAAAPVRQVGPVSGVAVLDTAVGGAGLVLEASRDGFVTLAFEKPVDAAIVAVSPALADAAWRVRAATATVSVGPLYPGILASCQGPGFPFALEEAVVAHDRITEGGVGVSEIRYRTVRGDLVLDRVPEADVIATWRPWHTATRGGRLGWVIEHPLTGALHLVRSPVSRFPFELVHPGLWSGSLTVEGLQ